jgi:hypothetical protein
MDYRFKPQYYEDTRDEPDDYDDDNERDGEPGSKIVFGFFVYRKRRENDDVEITGMVLVKQLGDRMFFTYAPIDPKNYEVDKFMEGFKDTIPNNEYDNNTTKVFEIDALDVLLEKLIIQKVGKPIPNRP